MLGYIGLRSHALLVTKITSLACSVAIVLLVRPKKTLKDGIRAIACFWKLRISGILSGTFRWMILQFSGWRHDFNLRNTE